MQNSEIITGLRNLAQTGSQYRRTVCRLAADTIEAQEKRIQELESQRREIAGQLKLEAENNAG